MYSRLPVIAVNSGGPTESIEDGKSGFLCEPIPDSFAKAVARILSAEVDPVAMGRYGRQVVERRFSLSVFIDNLERIAYSTIERNHLNIELKGVPKQ